MKKGYWCCKVSKKYNDLMKMRASPICMMAYLDDNAQDGDDALENVDINCNEDQECLSTQ